MLISSLFPRSRLVEMLQNLRLRGAPFGLSFTEMSILPNSKMVLIASEFARENNRFDEFHELVFRSFFTNGRDIGHIEVIKEIAHDAGLNVDSLIDALSERKYRARIDEVRQEAIENGVTSIPTFIIEERERIIGAQQVDVFRDTMKKYVM